MIFYEDTINKIKHFYDTVLTDPEKNWDENKIRRRSVEQHAIEELITECYIYYWKDPYDIIFEKSLYYLSLLKTANKGSKMKKSYKDANKILERVSYYIS